MAVALTQNLEKVLTLTDEMASGKMGPFDDEQQGYIDIVAQNARKLQEQNIMQYSLIGLSVKSHDLRQLLTALVGYSALLNSPKLSSHSTLVRNQLMSIHTLHDLARDIHWRLDGLILFANEIVRPRKIHPQDFGMLNIGGYLRAQAEHYICRKYVSAMTIPENLPNVYANDGQTKLMLRGLFSIALDITAQPTIDVSAYTVRNFVRVRVAIEDTADQYEEIMRMLSVKISRGQDASTTQSAQMTLGRIKSTTLIQLGLYITTNLATQQEGRMKLESDKNRLVFTVTMPTQVPQAAL